MIEKKGKILLIRFSSLGDLILLTALIDAIGEALPDLELHLATKEIYSELFEGSERVDRIHPIPEDAGIADLLDLRKRLSVEGFDIIIDAHNVLRSNLLYRTLRARRKVQLGKDQVRKLSLIRTGRDLYGDNQSMHGRYLGLLRQLGEPASSVPTRLEPDVEACARAVSFLDDENLARRRFVAIAPGARWETKRWQPASFGLLAQELADCGLGVLMIGDRSEMELCRTVAGGCGAAVACGRLSLMETAAALREASVLVTNDSAPLHLSEAVGTPVVALFGPTVRQFGYFPILPGSVVIERDLGCRPCSRNGSGRCRLENRECLDGIGHEEVLAEVLRIMREEEESG
jgi:heptosyltransferase-2